MSCQRIAPGRGKKKKSAHTRNTREFCDMCHILRERAAAVVGPSEERLGRVSSSLKIREGVRAN